MKDKSDLSFCTLHSALEETLMLLPEPRPSRWDLRWRMFGAEVRIRPIFWVSCLLLGIVVYRDPTIGGVGMFWFWLAAVLATLLAHETSHILAARLFGTCVRVVLSGLGGQVYGLDERKRWQRVLVLLAGSLGNMLIFGILWLATSERTPLPVERLGQDWSTFIANAAWVLMMTNALWCLLNVLPLWPLDGGRATVEVGEALLGRRGQTAALVVSLAVCLLLSLAVAWWAHLTLINRFDPLYLIHFLFFCIQVLYCYFFWLSAFRALWGDSEPLDETNKSSRAA
jgi:stage IV sporulation protein FB